MSVNKVILIGNLGADPDVKSFNNGGKVANVSLATSERWNDRQTGEKREHTEWHRVTFNDRLADIAERYLRKGSKVYVEGSIRTRKWTDQNGQDRYSTEIRAQSMQMLDSKGGNGGDYQGGQGNYQGSQNNFGNQNYPNQNSFGNQNYPHQDYPNQGYEQNGQYPDSDYDGDYDNNAYQKPAPKKSAPKPPVNPLSPNPQDGQPSEISDDDMPF